MNNESEDFIDDFGHTYDPSDFKEKFERWFPSSSHDVTP